MSRPFRCVAANVTEYIKTLSQAQELNVDEGEVQCQGRDDVCYGTIEVVHASRNLVLFLLAVERAGQCVMH